VRSLIVRCGFLALCGIAAWVPLKVENLAVPSPGFDGWPTEWDGTQLEQVALAERDAKFGRNFPGHIAKFTDGRRELIFRWVTTASRQLHSSADCFRGMGFNVAPRPAIRDPRGKRWSCFVASRRGHDFLVRERITDQRGNEWTDVSAWFWSALLQQTAGPWLAVTIVENTLD
jgi:hypothetical protein